MSITCNKYVGTKYTWCFWQKERFNFHGNYDGYLGLIEIANDKSHALWRRRLSYHTNNYKKIEVTKPEGVMLAAAAIETEDSNCYLAFLDWLEENKTAFNENIEDSLAYCFKLLKG